MQRRSAIVTLVGLAGALVAGVIALVAGFLGNAFRGGAGSRWTSLGRAEDLSPETFRRYVLRAPRKHAWVEESVPVVVYVKDLYPEDPIALLATCTHLGCTVEWDSESSRFLCPCHGGVYDAAGRVIAGPPPRGLKRLDVRIQDELCHIRLPAPGVEV